MPLPPLVEPIARLSAAETARTAQLRRGPQLTELDQRRVGNARVLVLGAGGLGAAALRQLAASGVGTIGILDSDAVEPRTPRHGIEPATTDAVTAEVERAAEALAMIAPEATVIQHTERLTPGTAPALIGGYDVVLDATDHVPARFLAADTCAALGTPLVWASVARFDGELSVFWPNPPAGSGVAGSAARDLVRPLDGAHEPHFAEESVLGALRGQLGSLMAAEAIKLIAGIGEPLIGRVLVIDALSGRFSERPLPGAAASPADPATS
jgi:molybdopterin/thiamine biosynthesis adenylyltransferase